MNQMTAPLFSHFIFSRWDGVIWEYLATQQKRHPIWTIWQQKEYSFQISTVQIHFAPLVSVLFFKLSCYIN